MRVTSALRCVTQLQLDDRLLSNPHAQHGMASQTHTLVVPPALRERGKRGRARGSPGGGASHTFTSPSRGSDRNAWTWAGLRPTTYLTLLFLSSPSHSILSRVCVSQLTSGSRFSSAAGSLSPAPLLYLAPTCLALFSIRPEHFELAITAVYDRMNTLTAPDWGNLSGTLNLRLRDGAEPIKLHTLRR